MLVQSRRFENVFWTHNDRGDIARIFAVTAEGELIREVRVDGAEHIDWEDITADDAGFLYIGDFGNNRKKHNDNYLAGKYKRIRFAGRKSEGICFAGSDIFFSNEQREIYKIPQSIFTDEAIAANN